jgi:hypothetical protein
MGWIRKKTIPGSGASGQKATQIPDSDPQQFTYLFT